MHWILALDFRNNPFHHRLWHVIHAISDRLKTPKNTNIKSPTKPPKPQTPWTDGNQFHKVMFWFFFLTPTKSLWHQPGGNTSYHFDYGFILLITQLRLQKAYSDWHFKVLVALLPHQLWMSVVFQGCKSKNCIPLEHFFSSLSYWEMLRFLEAAPGHP